MIRTLCAASAAVLLTLATASAVVFENLYNFSPDSFNSGSPEVETNSDGISPAGFVLSGPVLYGTTSSGGLHGGGTIFRVNRDGSGFTNLFNFNDGAYDPVTGTYPSSTGIDPVAGLLLISNTLYGTTFEGGLHDAGTVFEINTNGADYSVIFSFAFTNGQGPSSGLTWYNNALYGTTAGGGTNGYGTVFAINLSDLSFSSYYQFANPTEPYGNVVAVSNNLYGFGCFGGAATQGYVFRVGPAGFADLFDFTGVNGAAPYSGPVASGNTLYGLTYQGGTNGSGTIFRINTDGQNYTNLYSFSAANGANTDGANPYDFTGMVLAGNTLYGTTSLKGSGGQGTVFSVNTEGTDFSVLHSFAYSDGAQPDPLILTGNTLLGMTTYGVQGDYLGNGGIFELVLRPTLAIAAIGTNAILSWNDPSYSLYRAAAVTGAYVKVNGAASPYTNVLSGTQQYFKLQ
jgi:uncharacterized repeat protein (TIGR03803 family)